MDEHEQEHEVYGGEIPGDDGDMDADIERHDYDGDGQDYDVDDPNSKVPPPPLNSFHLCFLDLLLLLLPSSTSSYSNA